MRQHNQIWPDADMVLNFGGGKAPAPPKPPKIEAPKMPEFKFPEYRAPELPPTPPPTPVQVTTNDTESAANDVRVAAYRKKGIASTIFTNKAQALGAGAGATTLG